MCNLEYITGTYAQLLLIPNMKKMEATYKTVKMVVAHLASYEKKITLFTLGRVCGLEGEVGGGRIRSECGIVDTKKNGTRMKGYIVGKEKKKWAIHLNRN